VSPDPTAIDTLLKRLQSGDATAVGLLAQLTYSRLRLLVARMLNESFPVVNREHELDSVFNTAYLRLHDALSKMAAEASTPPTPADFFRFAAFKIRQVLLDLAGADRRRGRVFVPYGWSDEGSVIEPPESSKLNPPPETKARWAEFLEAVDALPEPQRTVFLMHFFMDMTQAQIADELRMTAKQVSREWLKACQSVGKFLPS
jgi:RNA polymerase sigma factor (sigma-70 family)